MTSDLPGALPLEEQLRAEPTLKDTLALPPALARMLPHGPRTPVARWLDKPLDDTPARERGLVFSVPDDVAGLTARGLRRRLESLVDAPAPIVFLDGASSPGRTRVVVLTASPTERDALYGAREPHEAVLLDDLGEFLDRWSLRAGVRLHAISRGQVELDVGRLPHRTDLFVEDLVQLGGHFHASDAAAREAFVSQATRHVVRLGGT